MPTLADRFEAKVDRSGEHHRWTGRTWCKADGSGLIKANGKPTTVRRVAWELAHGPLPPVGRVSGSGRATPLVCGWTISRLKGGEAPATPPLASETSGTGLRHEVRHIPSRRLEARA